MLADLSSRTALVTGGGQGIGRGIALKLAEQGADVAIADINDEGAVAVVDEVKAFNQKGMAVHMDVTDNASVDKCVNDVIAEFGHLDILVNNAGIGRLPGNAGTGLDDDWEQNWNAVMDINVQGIMRCTKAVIGHFMERKYGKIVNTASGAGRGPIWWGPPKGLAGMSNPYGPSKAAVISYTQYVRSQPGGIQHQRERHLPRSGLDSFPRTVDFADEKQGRISLGERLPRAVRRQCHGPGPLG